MRRGAKPAKSTVRALKNHGSKVRDLEKRLAEALKREAEALERESEAFEQQTATSEILRVISSSPSDLRPVFDTILANAARLCEAHRGAFLLFREGVFETAAESLPSWPNFLVRRSPASAAVELK
jgi:hypothetical protein